MLLAATQCLNKQKHRQTSPQKTQENKTCFAQVSRLFLNSLQVFFCTGFRLLLHRFQSRVGVIIDCPQKDLFHDPHDDNDDDELSLVVVREF